LSSLAAFCLIALALELNYAQGAQVETGFVDRVYSDEYGAHKYVVFVPNGYTPDRKWPVILFLHGAAERGTDGRLPTTVGLGPMVRRRAANFPFLVVFPQAEDASGPRLAGWAADGDDGRRAMRILAEAERQYSVDTARRILTGWSMGGYGAWSLGAATPEQWSAVVPISGGGDARQASRLKDVPVWAFAGADDRATPPRETKRMVDALNLAGGRVRYTEVAGIGHDVWQVVYDEDGLFAWMQNPKSGAGADVEFRVRPGRRIDGTAAAGEPFVPAIEIPRAVYLRFGNEMLQALSYSIVSRVPESAKRGRLNDIYSSTSASGRTFGVQFAGVGYQAEVVRAHVEAYRENRLNLQLALSNVKLAISRTFVMGESHSAVAGPILITLGSRRPVWLSVDVTPYVDRGRIRLRWVGSRFDISDDNWHVTGPYAAQTRGFGMTEEKVIEALRSGIFRNKSRLQREALALVPPLLAEVEKHLDLNETSELVSALWPLPVYRPRVRLWPQEVSTDPQGVSLILGVTAAAVDPRKAPPQPVRLAPAGPALSAYPRSTKLLAGVAPRVLTDLTGMLIDADVARIHVQDIPQEEFRVFADAAALSEAVPELKRFGEGAEIRAELVLAEPLGLSGGLVADATRVIPTSATEPLHTAANAEPGGASQLPVNALAHAADDGRLPGPDLNAPADGDETIRIEAPPAKSEPAKSESGAEQRPTEIRARPAARLSLDAPKVFISVAARSNAKDRWTEVAEFRFTIHQEADAIITQTGFARRGVRLEWSGDPRLTVEAHFVSGYAPENTRLDTDRIREMFAAAWKAWTASGPVAQVAVADVDFGDSRLRLDDISWSEPGLMISYAPPGIKIVNRSADSLVYEARGPFSGWGGPYRLAPGDSHEFPVASSIEYRQHSGRADAWYTVPVGAVCEFRSSPRGGLPSLFRIREAPDDVLTGSR
jgi:predicted esterase